MHTFWGPPWYYIQGPSLPHPFWPRAFLIWEAFGFRSPLSECAPLTGHSFLSGRYACYSLCVFQIHSLCQMHALQIFSFPQWLACSLSYHCLLEPEVIHVDEIQFTNRERVEWKMVPLLGKNPKLACSYLKVKHSPLIWSNNSSPRIYPGEMKAYVHIKTCSWIF